MLILNSDAKNQENTIFQIFGVLAVFAFSQKKNYLKNMTLGWGGAKVKTLMNEKLTFLEPSIILMEHFLRPIKTGTQNQKTCLISEGQEKSNYFREQHLILQIFILMIC